MYLKSFLPRSSPPPLLPFSPSLLPHRSLWLQTTNNKQTKQQTQPMGNLINHCTSGISHGIPTPRHQTLISPPRFRISPLPSSPVPLPPFCPATLKTPYPTFAIPIAIPIQPPYPQIYNTSSQLPIPISDTPSPSLPPTAQTHGSPSPFTRNTLPIQPPYPHPPRKLPSQRAGRRQKKTGKSLIPSFFRPSR